MLAESSRGFGDSKQLIIYRNLYYYSAPALDTPLIPKVNYKGPFLKVLFVDLF